MSVEVARLDNGLTVATDAMAAAETVSLGAWVRVGARHEQARLNGVAHFLEHMVFKGTRRRSARDIAEAIEAVGGQINAYTGRETTAFYSKVLADDMPLALDIVADILQHSTFDPTELDRERAVVLQEIGQVADTPDEVIFDHFQETAYPDQALGRPIQGSNETVTALLRDELIDYLSQHYGAGDIVLAAAGRLDHADFCARAAEAFDALPAGGVERPEPARYRGGDFREERDLEQVHLLLGFEGIGYLDPDHYAALVLSTLLGGGMSSRLFQEVRERRGLAYSISSCTAAYADSGLFSVYAGTGETQVDELLTVVCEEFEKLLAGISEEEVERASAQLKASILMARESSLSRCERLAHDIQIYGRPLANEEIIAEIEAVDRPALERLTGRLTAGRPTLALLGPIAGAVPYERLQARFAHNSG